MTLMFKDLKKGMLATGEFFPSESIAWGEQTLILAAPKTTAEQHWQKYTPIVQQVAHLSTL